MFSVLFIISSFYLVQVSICSLILIQKLPIFCYDWPSAPSPAQVSFSSLSHLLRVFCSVYHQLLLSCAGVHQFPYLNPTTLWFLLWLIISSFYPVQVSLCFLILIQQLPNFCYDWSSAHSPAQVSISPLFLGHRLPGFCFVDHQLLLLRCPSAPY